MIIGYFLEDIAHERFLRALVQRVAVERGIPAKLIRHDVRNATGGASIRSYKDFLKDYNRGREGAFDLMVVAVDGNCIGHNAKRAQLQQLQTDAEYHGQIVFAIPDPHIEYWYLLDAAACQRALDAPRQPQTPTYKCAHNEYKHVLRKIVVDSGIDPAFGGTEYGEAIVNEMDLYAAGRIDPRNSFSTFLADLRAALQPFASAAPTDASEQSL